jgi:hypothetical protein
VLGYTLMKLRFVAEFKEPELRKNEFTEKNFLSTYGSGRFPFVSLEDVEVSVETSKMVFENFKYRGLGHDIVHLLGAYIEKILSLKIPISPLREVTDVGLGFSLVPKSKADSLDYSTFNGMRHLLENQLLSQHLKNLGNFNILDLIRERDPDYDMTVKVFQRIFLLSQELGEELKIIYPETSKTWNDLYISLDQWKENYSQTMCRFNNQGLNVEGMDDKIEFANFLRENRDDLVFEATFEIGEIELNDRILSIKDQILLEIEKIPNVWK